MRKSRLRRRLSMTSLIDVIFLLLLFFMLSSTFSKFAEVELTAGSGGARPGEAEARPLFLRLASESVNLNGRDIALDDLPKAFAGSGTPEDAPEPDASAAAQPVIVSLKPDVSAQRLTDLLIVLRQIDGVSVTVLGTE